MPKLDELEEDAKPELLPANEQLSKAKGTLNLYVIRALIALIIVLGGTVIPYLYYKKESAYREGYSKGTDDCSSNKIEEIQSLKNSILILKTLNRYQDSTIEYLAKKQYNQIAIYPKNTSQ